MKSDRIPLAEVRRRLGPALFGTEWIEKLTAKERWDLEKNPVWPNDGFLLPIKTVPGSQSYRLPNDLTERVEFMRWQETKILRWLDRNQIVVIVAADGRRSVPRADFERAFAKAFPAIGNSAEALPARVDARPPGAKRGGIRKKDDDAALAKIKAALKDDPILSKRGAILKHGVPPKATEKEQEAIVRRMTKKLKKPAQRT